MVGGRSIDAGRLDDRPFGGDRSALGAIERRDCRGALDWSIGDEEKVHEGEAYTLAEKESSDG